MNRKAFHVVVAYQKSGMKGAPSMPRAPSISQSPHPVKSVSILLGSRGNSHLALPHDSVMTARICEKVYDNGWRAASFLGSYSWEMI